MRWVIGVEVPDIDTEASVRVTQNAQLTADETVPGRFRMSQALASVTVTLETAGTGPRDHEFPPEDLRIFKLAGEEGERGRRMTHVTRGRFLVVAPESWSRDEERSGQATCEPEPVAGGGCRAHHFDVDRDGDGEIVFVTSEGERRSVPGSTSDFTLDGYSLEDALAGVGPLFVAEPPAVRARADARYALVVVREEGQREASGWRAHAKTFEELRTRIRGRGAGWFFVRFHDAAGELIESQDFRFCEGLQGIEVKSGPVIPHAGGHSPATVTFRHSWGCRVALSGPSAPGLAIERSPNHSIVHLPPARDNDETRWSVQQGSGSADVIVRLERLWWALVEEGTEPREWTDRPITLSREDFRATSPKEIWFDLPAAGWARDVRVGFERWRSKPLRLSSLKDVTTLPLRELGGARELEEPGTEHTVKIWVQPAARAAAELEGRIATLKVPALRAPVGRAAEIDLSVLRPQRLMSVLTQQRRLGDAALRAMLADWREQRYKPRRVRTTEEREAFFREGLCLLALFLDEAGRPPARTRVGRRWRQRAEWARRRFADTFARLQESCDQRAVTRARRRSKHRRAPKV
ncbi:MAG: hypothetical protein AB1486_19840 [Planctomycetota bacterium]